MVMLKKRAAAVLTAAALMVSGAAGIPQSASAEGTAAVKASVHFSAGVPGGFDIIDEQLNVQGDLAEKYFPAIAANEPAGVSYADALVAAHVKKYGGANVRKYLELTPGTVSSGQSTVSDEQVAEAAKKTVVRKQFGHVNAGLHFINDTACADSVSVQIKNRDYIFAGASDSEGMNLGYAFFEKNAYAVKVGKKVHIRADFKTIDGDENGKLTETKKAPLTNVKVSKVNVKSGQLNSTSHTTNSSGIVTMSFDEPGEKYITLNGKVTAKNGETVLTSAVAKVKVVLKKTKIKKTSSTIKTVKLKWKKSPGAKKYEVFRSAKKKGKFKKIKLVSSTKFVNKKLKSGKKYFYKVRAYAKSDGKAVRSEFSKTVAVKTKKPAPKVVRPSTPSYSSSSSSSSSKKSSSSKSSSSSRRSSSSSSHSSAMDKLRKLFNLFR